MGKERQKTGEPHFQKKYRRHIDVAQRLAMLAETGKLPEKMAAKHIGSHLLKLGRIRATPVAKSLIETGKVEGVDSPCDGCTKFPSCLTEHHVCWPASDYEEDPISFAYRELPENKVMLCEGLHRDLHGRKREVPPPKPPPEKMVDAIIKFAQRYDHDFEQAVVVMIRPRETETAA